MYVHMEFASGYTTIIFKEKKQQQKDKKKTKQKKTDLDITHRL